MIELVDDQLGRIMKTLETTGQRNNTIVVYSTDHGEMLGDHGLIGKGCRFYEGQVHVPVESKYSCA
jgi:arylsulfatase A-like enzyme